jgi:hypothetical protein
MTLSNSADLNNLKVGNLFHIGNVLKYSEFYIGRNEYQWRDNTISQVTHVNFKTISPFYVSEDYVLISSLTILLNITFLKK